MSRNIKQIKIKDKNGNVLYYDLWSQVGTIPDDKTVADIILEDEEVTADALTTLNASCGFNINGQFKPLNYSKRISGATSLTEAVEIVDDAIDEVSDKIGDVSNYFSVEDGLTSISQAIGLDSNVELTFPSNTPYISGATSIQEALIILATELEKKGDGLTTVQPKPFG